MAGMDNIVSMVGDWTPPLIPSLLNEEFSPRPFSDFLVDGNNGTVLNSEKEKLDIGSKEHEGDAGFQFSSNLSLEPCILDAHKPNTRSALSERMATRAGFSPLKINTSIRSGNLDSSTSEVQSPYLTIPPGLSPTTLLDSPVFLSNLAQPSPTTGKLLFEQHNSINSVSTSVVSEKVESHLLEDGPESFAFKPHVESSPSYFPNPEIKPLQMDVSVHSEQSVRSGSLEVAAIPFQKQHDFNFHSGFPDSSERKDDSIFNQKASESFLGSEQSPPPDDQQDAEADTKGEFSSVVAGAPAEDGYNWRKYGQKQVKGSEYPRSYYKCTHPNCPVKKKVERSHEGHITEIIYKGAHNHPKPPPNRRSGVGPHSFNDMQPDGSENPVSQVTLDGKALFISSQGVNGGHDWKNNGTSASIPGELAEPSASLRTQDGPCFESPDAAIDVSSTLSNDEEDDQATHGSVSLGGEGEGDELESKRRKIDASMVDMTAASRAVREPRVVVQTTSEVDILDDGYRWRKYGQKVVKGNPNPRSYYKCTNPGCTVRKHVERASHDLKSVITTYEGKHNHDVPAARSNGHSSSGGTSTAAAAPPAIVPQPQSLNRRAELTQLQDSLMRFNASVHLPAFNLSREHLGPPPGTNFAFPMVQHGLSNLGIPGLSAMPPMKMPALPPHLYFSHHRQLSEPGFMIPKGEPKEEPIPEPGLPVATGAAASVYHQMMSRLPLGP